MAIMKILGERKAGCFHPNSKRPRTDAVQDIPIGCGSFKAQDRDAIVKPSDNDDHGKKIDKGSVPFSHSSSICAEFVNTIPAKNCPPPPRKLKKFLVERDFPEGCGRLAPSSCKNSGVGSENFMLGCKSAVSVDCCGDAQERRCLTPLVKEQERGELVGGHKLTVVCVDCKKVKKALDAYEETLMNILRDVKSKEQGCGKHYVAAAMSLRKQGKWVNMRKQLGSIPGVKIGHQFQYRAQLPVVGLHGPFEPGIDYLNKDGKILATSVVASGRYANDVASFDALTFLGQGGNPMVTQGNPKDQKLEGGNLALKNSMEARTPVRVIRGFKCSKPSSFVGTRAKTVITYVYDGLYLVDDFRLVRGTFGKLVFKFLLSRILGQPKLTRGKVLDKLKRSKVSHNIVCKNDISQGKEKMPIRVVNEIDDESPPSFNYITNVIYPDFFKPTTQTGCGCTDGCSESKPCPCVMKNAGVLPYKCNGCLINVKPLVYECGTSCMCSSSCKNRVSQHGIHFKLEVFKTKSKGWGVRSRSYIPSGSFVCEYTGEILQVEEVKRRLGSDECLFGTKGNHALQDRRQPFFFPMLSSLSEEDRFTINASQHGNVGRFVNHSCSPNLCVQNVLYDHDDKRMPHTMLFAMKNIPPFQELTYDHNYIFS